MQTIATLSSRDSSVESVVFLLNELKAMAPKDAVVSVRGWNSGDVAQGRLIERKLIDGSAVYDILLNPTTYDDPAAIR